MQKILTKQNFSADFLHISQKKSYNYTDILTTNMTKLGEYLDKKAVNKAQISRRTGLSKQRVSELSTNVTSKLRADELYLIALSIEVNPCDLLDFVCGGFEVEEGGLTCPLQAFRFTISLTKLIND